MKRVDLLKRKGTTKEQLTDFSLIVVGNVFFAMVCGVGIQFLRLSSNSSMNYGYLETFLIVVFLLTTVMFFAHLIYQMANNASTTSDDNLVQESGSNPSTTVTPSPFAAVEETSMIIGANPENGPVNSSVINSSIQEQEIMDETMRQEVLAQEFEQSQREDEMNSTNFSSSNDSNMSSSPMSNDDINMLIQIDENENSMW